MLAAFLAALVFFHSSEFLLALWSTGKPDLRSVHHLCLTGGTSLHNAASECPSPPTSIPPASSFPSLITPYLPAAHPHLAPFRSPLPCPFLWPVALFQSPPPASHAAFLVSWEYLLAMEVALTEYALETALFPAFKRRLWPMAWVGGALLLVGEAVHKAAMVTARRSFTHAIQMEKRREHRLVTYGLYRWVRHPGYTGWFMWSIAICLHVIPCANYAFPHAHMRHPGYTGVVHVEHDVSVVWCNHPMPCPCRPRSHGRWVRHPGYTGWFMWSIAMQLQLVNPLCTLAFALVSWRFFAARIPSLPRYAASVSFAIPFVSSAPTSARPPLLSLFPPAATS
ncbi:unnamed protein product [Closterium sp. NIES-65]|nr:unnamed protein product [Closterium sp. NIES-65]